MHNRCVNRLADFRRAHFSLVQSHIMAPKLAEANSCNQGEAAVELGTGGSPLEAFLSNNIRATQSAKIKVDSRLRAGSTFLER
jgi:hypothetical protein